MLQAASVGVGVAAVGCCLKARARNEECLEETEESDSIEDKREVKSVMLDLSGTTSEEFRLERSICGSSIASGSADYRYRPTRYGALSTRVFPEAQESKEKKMEKIASTVEAHAPLTEVVAVPVGEVPLGENRKVIHFLRHGEGTSNSAARLKGKEQYKSTEWLDARLTDLGKKQAADISQFVLTAELQVELVLVSPLRRATETGCIAFASRSVPFAACELLRERAHGNPCDRRRPRSELHREFPAVDHSSIAEEDPLRDKEGCNGESWLDTSKRAAEFLEYLATRPETSIAVVTHSAFLLTLFNIVLKEVDSSLHEWFETGELRSVILVFP
eukprot:TRINITY_DN11554_c0_g1_i1.p1 TRINITY_DN11554_c0_g1~~TRINITY_DN11554_c0_g1_i1.p1  ORF type:complete len:332 (+),score=34.96 TRINITY_DN11554_c0_g1_i1:34-1029(+)